jgi:hypothetical protein
MFNCAPYNTMAADYLEMNRDPEMHRWTGNYVSSPPLKKPAMH